MEVSQMLFTGLRKFPFIPSLSNGFIMKSVGFCPVLSVSTEMTIYGFCSLFYEYSIGYITLIEFYMLNQPCISKFYLVMVYTLSYLLLNFVH